MLRLIEKTLDIFNSIMLSLIFLTLIVGLLFIAPFTLLYILPYFAIKSTVSLPIYILAVIAITLAIAATIYVIVSIRRKRKPSEEAGMPSVE